MRERFIDQLAPIEDVLLRGLHAIGQVDRPDGPGPRRQRAVSDAAQPLLARLAPPSAAEGLSRPRYLYEQALAEPSTALTLVDVKPQPVTLAQSQAVIEQLLWNQKKRVALQDESKDLRAKARIDYLGKFAAGTTPAPAASAALPDAAPIFPSAPASAASVGG